MYPISESFRTQLKKSHKMVTRVDLYNDGNLVATPTLRVLDGNITIQDQPIHRRMTLTVTDPTGTLTPSGASDLLAPLGNELRLYRGLRIDATGVDEYIPLGVFGISDVRIHDSGDGFNMAIDGYDRARKVSRARFTTEHVVLQGTNVATAIQTIVQPRVPGVVFNFPSISNTTPLLVFEAGSDPWKACQEMADGIGYDLYFDPDGICVMVTVPIVTTETQTDWAFTEGPDCTMLYANKRLNDEKTYNHVVITGENNGTPSPVRAEAKDTNTSSPTYYLGDYGDVVYFQASKFITTVGQAQAVADARLQKVLGLVESVELLTLVNPAHETGDVVEVTRALSKINNKYIVDKITVPMTQDRGMNISVRQVNQV